MTHSLITMRNPSPKSHGTVAEVARLFLTLGVLGFGGPAAHIAMMRDEVVRKRSWVSDDEFLEYVGITNLIPGPNSTELAIHIGKKRAGATGLVVAGVSFIVPAVAIVSLLAWVYDTYGTRPEVFDVRYGVLPVIIAIVAHAVLGLGRSTLKSTINTIVVVAAFTAFIFDVHELVILLASGGFTSLWMHRNKIFRRGLSVVAVPLILQAAVPVTRWRLLTTFLEIGSVLYGSGYVLLAFLQRHLVDDLGWLTSQQLLDSIAIGQVTPGPVFTTATFIGWQVDGILGAAISTIGIFLPSFVFVAGLSWIVPWIRSHLVAQSFLTGVTTASLGLMAGVLVDLVNIALTDMFTVVVAMVAVLYLLRTKWNSAWLIAGGVAIGISRIVIG